MLELYKFNITPQLVDIYLKLIPQSYLNKLHVPFYFLQYYVAVPVVQDQHQQQRNLSAEEELALEKRHRQMKDNGELATKSNDSLGSAASKKDRKRRRHNNSAPQKKKKSTTATASLSLGEDGNLVLDESSHAPELSHAEEQLLREMGESSESIAQIRKKRSKTAAASGGTSTEASSSQSSPSQATATATQQRQFKYMSILYCMLGFIYQYTLFEDKYLKKRRRKLRHMNQSYYMNDFFDSPEDEFLDEMDFYEILRDERMQQQEKNAQSQNASTASSDRTSKGTKSKKKKKKKESNVTYLHVKTNHDQIMELGEQIIHQQHAQEGRDAPPTTESRPRATAHHLPGPPNSTKALSMSRSMHRRFKLTSILRMLNSIRGVFKFYLSYSTKDNISLLFMNYLDMLFLDKKYKMAISTRLKSGNLFLKMLLRRSFHLGGKKFFYSISAWNIWYMLSKITKEVKQSVMHLFGKEELANRVPSPISQPASQLPLVQRIFNVIKKLSCAHSISYKNYRLRFKSFPLSNSKKFSITKQGWHKIPLSQKRILSQWKFYNERFEREFSNAYERELYDYNDNWIELWKWLQLLLYAVQQSLKTVYSLVCLNMTSFKAHLSKSANRIKSFLLLQYFEQLFTLSSGYYSKISTELSWRVMPNDTTQYGVRIPLEWHWGCDLFRVWIYMDAISEYWMDNHKESLVDVLCSSPSKPFFHPLLRRPLKELPGVSQWRHRHIMSISITMFDLFTVFSYTFSLHSTYRKVLCIYKRFIQIVRDWISKNADESKGLIY